MVAVAGLGADDRLDGAQRRESPLAITGQEAVWTQVYRDLGLGDEEIRAFLVGPAYLPWGWMGNIDGLGGPLPASWIAGHQALEQRILARERGSA